MTVLFLASCRYTGDQSPPLNPAEYKESLIKANKEAVLTESEQIMILFQDTDGNDHDFLGLRYMIYFQGDGAK